MPIEIASVAFALFERPARRESIGAMSEYANAVEIRKFVRERPHPSFAIEKSEYSSV
ncbi:MULTISPECIES: hypothetical protein [Burkholderia]|uniref:hypothetical protein n=1 Tax=Burkholderia TaxID=32008 RepID=UPI0012E34AA0|nr:MULTISPECIES: hypothetical protein [Burkholderia]